MTETKTINLLWQAITPLHVGTGQDGGLVDLPVAREAATGFPMLPASGIKGSFREGNYDENSNTRYGTNERQGDVIFTDARLLALAVPSFKGTYALVTCPLVLYRLGRDRSQLLPGAAALPQLKIGDDQIIAPETLVDEKKHVQLQDYRLSIGGSNDKLSRWSDLLLSGLDETDRKVIRERLCAVSNQVFSFLCETSLDISPHVRLEEDFKTVASGALWWEECIPAESLLTSFVICRNPKDAKDFNRQQLRRIGGKNTVGRGLAQVIPVKEA